MEYIRCPDSLNSSQLPAVVIFMAGGITGCPNWQDDITAKVMERNKFKDGLILVNPRRENWKDFGTQSSIEQIDWEHEHLAVSDWIYFWFPKEGSCMITLFELGCALGADRPIRVGVEPGYCRELDVRRQVFNRRAYQHIHDNLEDLYRPLL